MKKISIFNLARQNMKRRIFRNLMIIITVALATGTLFTASVLLRGVERGIREGVNSLGADIMIMPQSVEGNIRSLLTGESDSMIMGGLETAEFTDVNLMSDIAKVPGVGAVTPQIYLSTWDEGGACCRLANVSIIGFDPETDFIVQRLVENKFQNKKPFDREEIFLGYNITVEMADYEVLRVWQVYGYDFKAIGRLKKTGTALDYALFIPMSGIWEMIKSSKERAIPEEAMERLGKLREGLVSVFLVRTSSLEVDPKELSTNLKAATPGMTVVSTAEMITRLQRQLHGTMKSLIYSGIIVWVMSILVVGAIFSVAVNERKRELGLLRAIGFRRNSVFKLVMYESSILAGLGGLFGLLAGLTVISQLRGFFQETLKMPFLWPSEVYLASLILICLAAGLGSGVFGALYPAARISLMEPLQAIRSGE